MEISTSKQQPSHSKFVSMLSYFFFFWKFSLKTRKDVPHFLNKLKRIHMKQVNTEWRNDILYYYTFLEIMSKDATAIFKAYNDF